MRPTKATTGLSGSTPSSSAIVPVSGNHFCGSMPFKTVCTFAGSMRGYVSSTACFMPADTAMTASAYSKAFFSDQDETL